MNKITFYRFSKSEPYFNKRSLCSDTIAKINLIDKLIKNEKESRHKPYFKLTEREQENMSKCIKAIENISNEIIKKGIYVGGYDVADFIDSFCKSIKDDSYYIDFRSIKKNLGESPLFGIDLEEVERNELIKTNLEKLIEFDFKGILEKSKTHDRIEIEELDNLNNEVEEMNKNGWEIKQIEGIQSGNFDIGYDYSYGYGFTEGILIVWEKK